MILETQVELADHTTIGLGGPARWYALCNTNDDLIDGLKWARSKGLQVHILGGGSNSLVADAGFQGLVLHNRTSGIIHHGDGMYQAAAGVLWDDFALRAISDSMGGIECLCGIPGSVGATPIQNVGAYGQDVSEVITRVDALDRTTLSFVTFTNQECAFSYRHSRFKAGDRGKYLITSVWFQLKPAGEILIRYPELGSALEEMGTWKNPTSRQEKLHAVRECVLKIRGRKGMVLNPADPNSRSLGSFFTNPVVSTALKNQVIQVCEKSELPKPPIYATNEAWKISAAWLIEQSGTKRGETLRGAAVSEKHVLALMNRGNASTSDILALAQRIHDRVKSKFGIDLSIEPELIGVSG